jgi:phosphoribosylamine--glycine ligase
VTTALVIGKDGRTDCIGEAVCSSGGTLYSLCEFANPGLKRKSKVFRVGRTDDVPGVVALAAELKPDLAIIGPEEPLAAGLVDALQGGLGIPCVGPTKSLARLETSKAFTRRLSSKYDIAGNVEYMVFDSLDGLPAYLQHLGEFVIKPDGLTGGKGVKVFGDHLHSLAEALAYAKVCLERGPVVVEEKLDGEEFSLQSFCDGEYVVDMPPVQDHKRAHEYDSGPNTGGMGSYSCEDRSLPFLAKDDLEAASAVNRAVARALYAEFGQPYRGILYGGFMATAKGIRLLEYNARFGDPEALNVLPLLETNFLAICEAITTGRLSRLNISFRDRATVCKYVVPKGYPTNPVRNVAIDLDRVPEYPSDRLRTYFAAVEERDGSILLTGSRALAFVGMGHSLDDAERIAERAASSVEGPVDHRRDIGTTKLIRRRVDHIKRLRGTDSTS